MLQELLVRLGLQARQEVQDQQDPQVLQDLRAVREQQVQQDLKVIKEASERLDQLVLQAQLDQQVHREQTVQRVL